MLKKIGLIGMYIVSLGSLKAHPTKHHQATSLAGATLIAKKDVNIPPNLKTLSLGFKSSFENELTFSRKGRLILTERAVIFYCSLNMWYSELFDRVLPTDSPLEISDVLIYEDEKQDFTSANAIIFMKDIGSDIKSIHCAVTSSSKQLANKDRLTVGLIESLLESNFSIKFSKPKVIK